MYSRIHTITIRVRYIFFYVILFSTFISCNIDHNKLAPAYSDSFKKHNFFYKLSASAISLTHHKVIYDPSYFSIGYPNGDIPSDRGVCSDVVIRSYRKLGVDLQKEVHEDMRKHFQEYPKTWGLKLPDRNIDHRRVPNLMKYFERKNAALPISINANDYKFGEIVCWDLGNGLRHIGLVIDKKSTDGKRNLIVHNIGGGQVIADFLFRFKIMGHYRFDI